MSDTIRELIIQDFLTRAAVIRTGSPSDYRTDIGAQVERCRKNPPTNCVNVWPHPEVASKTYGKQQHIMPILLEGNLAFGDENPSIVSERILGDLIKAFTDPAWSRSPDYIGGIDYVSGGTGAYPDDEDHTVGASAQFNVHYETNIGDPYSQGG